MTLTALAGARRWDAATAACVALAAMGAAALNMWMERDLDARMRRTRNRPLPTGRVSPTAACVFGSILTASGLALAPTALSATLTAATLALYLLVYTPLKRVTPFALIPGAVAGALPPLIGCAAVAPLDGRAFLLFALLFVWQFPHFLALGRLHRDDYARAGLKLATTLTFSDRAARRLFLASLIGLPAVLACGLLL